MPYSGMRIRAAPGADIDALARRIDEDPRFALEARPEQEYYADQAESFRVFYVLVVGLAVLAGIGAIFGATNTLYAAVLARRAEIGTLRALGFSRGAIRASFLIESQILATAGFGVGATLAWALGGILSSALGGVGFTSTTFTTNVIQLRVGASDMAMAFGLALTLGIIGGYCPAARASKMRPVEALRRG